MFDLSIPRSSFTYHWSPSVMLGALPVPNTTLFVDLCRQLAPYGMTPKGVVLDGGSTQLGEVGFHITLLGDRARIRFGYDGFEVVVTDLDGEDDFAAWLAMADAARVAVTQFAPDIERGRVGIVWRAHLELAQPAGLADVIGGVVDFRSTDRVKSKPLSVVASLEWEPAFEIVNSRISVEKSLLVPQGTFVELAVDYDGLLSLEETARRFAEAKREVLVLLELADVKSSERQEEESAGN